MNQSNVMRLMSAEERFRERLMTARAMLRLLIDESEVTEDVLAAVSDLADDLRKAAWEFRHG
jgi:hypothetical protein